MPIDWSLFAIYAAPVLALIIGALLDRIFEQRPKLITYMVHSSAITMRPPQGAQFNVHSHSVVVRNAGRRPAHNVRLGHAVFPRDHSVYPACNYQVVVLLDGTSEIVIPVLAPGDQFIVSYLYSPPVLFSDVNTYAKCDEGIARILTVLPTPQPSKWVLRGVVALMFLGAVTVIYMGIEFVRFWAQ